MKQGVVSPGAEDQGLTLSGPLSDLGARRADVLAEWRGP